MLLCITNDSCDVENVRAATLQSQKMVADLASSYSVSYDAIAYGGDFWIRMTTDKNEMPTRSRIGTEMLKMHVIIYVNKGLQDKEEHVFAKNACVRH